VTRPPSDQEQKADQIARLKFAAGCGLVCFGVVFIYWPLAVILLGVSFILDGLSV
jgi:hypothetical protein